MLLPFSSTVPSCATRSTSRRAVDAELDVRVEHHLDLILLILRAASSPLQPSFWSASFLYSAPSFQLQPSEVEHPYGAPGEGVRPELIAKLRPELDSK